MSGSNLEGDFFDDSIKQVYQKVKDLASGGGVATKAEIAALTPIADTSTTTATANGDKINAIIAALQA